MLQSTVKKPSLDKASNKKILSPVPYECGFHFFSGVGKYTGETAVTFFSFGEELRTIAAESIRFHLQRGDFQHWIQETLGDADLAQRIDRIDAGLSDTDFRRELLRVVQARFEELQTVSKSE